MKLIDNSKTNWNTKAIIVDNGTRENRINQFLSSIKRLRYRAGDKNASDRCSSIIAQSIALP